MQKTAFLASLLLVTACTGVGGVNPIDPQGFLSSLDGPKVPTMQETQMDGAKNAEKNGDFKQAAAVYQQILSKHPDDKDAQLGLADSYRRSGNYDEALAAYNEILRKDPSIVGAKEGKGLALMGKGDMDTPATIFADVLKTDPTRWKTLNALGILFTTRNMQPEAQQYFTEALRQSPANPSIMNNLGLSQALGHNFDGGIASLKQASALTNGSTERKRIDLNLALVYAIAGRVDDAKAIAETYFTGATLDNNLGLYAHLAKDDQMAKAYLNMALTSSKTFYEKAWNNLQTIESSSGASPSNIDSGGQVTLSGEGSNDMTPPPVDKPAPKKVSKPKKKAAAAPAKQQED